MEQAQEMVKGEEEPKIPVKCKCGYRWKTKTKLGYISCPNCRHTNKTEDAIKAAQEDATPESVAPLGKTKVVIETRDHSKDAREDEE